MIGAALARLRPLAFIAWAISGPADAQTVKDACAAPGGSGVFVQLTCAALSAVNDADSVRLSALIDEKFLITTVSGRTISDAKQQMVDAWTKEAAPGVTSRSFLSEVRSSWSVGDVGVITGTITDMTEEGTSRSCARHAFTDIWVKRKRVWRWVQSHESGLLSVAC